MAFPFHQWKVHSEVAASIKSVDSTPRPRCDIFYAESVIAVHRKIIDNFSCASVSSQWMNTLFFSFSLLQHRWCNIGVVVRCDALLDIVKPHPESKNEKKCAFDNNFRNNGTTEWRFQKRLYPRICVMCSRVHQSREKGKKRQRQEEEKTVWMRVIHKTTIFVTAPGRMSAEKCWMFFFFPFPFSTHLHHHIGTAFFHIFCWSSTWW